MKTCLAVLLWLPLANAARCACTADQISDGICHEECNTESCDYDGGDCLEHLREQYAERAMCAMAVQHQSRRLCTDALAKEATCDGAFPSGEIPVSECDESCALTRCLLDAQCHGVSFRRHPDGAVATSILVQHLDFRSSAGIAECYVKHSKLVCTDTCPTSGNSVCDDGSTGPNAVCPYGSDCADCGVRHMRPEVLSGFSSADFCWTAAHSTFRLCSAPSKEQPIRSDTCSHADENGVIRAERCDASCLVALCAAEPSCAGIHLIAGASIETYEKAVLLWFIGEHEANARYMPCYVKSERLLCSDTCNYANDGFCNDGITTNRSCPTGTDCSDCGPRALQEAGHLQHPAHDVLCKDACPLWNRDGVCQDGGDASSGDQLCSLGTDCTDCGERVQLEHWAFASSPTPPQGFYGVCSDTCTGMSNDGVCDDGGANAETAHCGFGEDCSDCGVRHPPFYERGCSAAAQDLICPARSTMCRDSLRDGTFTIDLCDLHCLVGRCFDSAECVGVLELGNGRNALLRSMRRGEQRCFAKGTGAPQYEGVTMSPPWGGVMTINNYTSARTSHIWIAVFIALGFLCAIALGAVYFVRGALYAVPAPKDPLAGTHRRMSRSSAISAMSEFTATPRSVGCPKAYADTHEVCESCGGPSPKYRENEEKAALMEQGKTFESILKGSPHSRHTLSPLPEPIYPDDEDLGPEEAI